MAEGTTQKAPVKAEAPAKQAELEAAPVTPLHQPLLHESGLKHTSGEARYVDDVPAPGLLVGQVFASPHARAKLLSLDVTAARAVKGVAGVFTAADVPGHNDLGAVVHDEPLFAKGRVSFLGQAVALVVADTYEAGRAGVAAIVAEWEPEEAIVTLDAAVEKGAFLTEPHVIARGDVDAGFARAELVLEGRVQTGGQDHFYLETHATLAIPGEGPSLTLACSTQHPTEVQTVVARALGWGRHQVVVEVPRMGGGFGGKETQAAPFAAMASLAAVKTGRPVKVWLNRDQDMAWTGKRHPFSSTFKAGFLKDGALTAFTADVVSDGGYSADLSQAILDRCLFHLDNAYFLPAVRVTGRVARTNLPSNTAFRGFGGPQGMAVIEEVMDRAAETLQLDPAAVREKNFYGDGPRDVTQYHQTVKDNRIGVVWPALLQSADYAQRRADIEAFNASSKWVKRGLGITPVKFGISFTTSFLNQAGALVVVYADGSVQLNHGGTEMGQGLHTKMLAVCAHELGIPPQRVRVMTTSTDKVPNTSATAASSGSDLNGQAVQQAAGVIRLRLTEVARGLLKGDVGDEVVFAGGRVFLAAKPELALPFEQVTQAAYLQQVPLSATGFYRTPDITYDRAAGRGKPFHYYAWGAAVSEVEVSGLTGEHRLRRVDILQDVGRSLVPTIDRGQVEGAYLQGWGWLTVEEVLFDDKGFLRTHSPDTYKIPALGDAPLAFHVALLENAAQHDVIHGSKAVGEPPFMLALSAVAALRHAVGAWGPKGEPVTLAIPCTPEAVLFAVEAARKLKAKAD